MTEKPIQYSEHRGLFCETEASTITVNSLEEFKTLIAEKWGSADIEITYYCYSPYLKSDRYIVVHKEHGVVGYLNNLFTELIIENENAKERELKLEEILHDDLYDTKKWKVRSLRGRVEWLVANCGYKNVEQTTDTES